MQPQPVVSLPCYRPPKLADATEPEEQGDFKQPGEEQREICQQVY